LTTCVGVHLRLLDFEPVRDGKCQGAISERVMILAWPLAKWIRSIWRIASEIHRKRIGTRDRSMIACAVTNRSREPCFKHVCITLTGIFGHVDGTRRDLFRTGPCEQWLYSLGTVTESILVSLVCWIDM